jgi:predicted ATPase
MRTSLEIENLKGIAARQRIDFRAATLLFGANSVGKSSNLQALLYLHELIERGLIQSFGYFGGIRPRQYVGRRRR